MSDYPMLISNKLHSFRNFVSQIDIEMNDILFLSLMTFLIFATSDSLFAYEKHIYFFVLAYYFGIERPR